MSILGLLLAGVAVHGSWTQANVSLSLRATNLKSALEKVSEASGELVIPSVELRDQIITLHVHNRPVSQLAEDIAKVVHGQVEKITSGYLIKRSKDLQAQLEKEEFAGLERRIRINQEIVKRQTDTMVGDTAAYLSRIRNGLQTDIAKQRIPNEGQVTDTMYFPSGSLHPDSVLVARIYKMIDPVEMARMRDQENVVFAYPANKIQKPLPQQAAQTALKECNQLTDLVQGQDFADGENPATSKMYWKYYFEALSKAKPMSKIIAVVRRREDSYFCMVYGFDADGQYVNAGWRLFSPDPEESDNAQSFVQELPEGMEPPSLSDISREYVVDSPAKPYMPRSFLVDSEPTVKLSDNLQKLLKTANRIDPLSAVSTDVLWKLGEELNRDVVACVPDSFDASCCDAFHREKFSWANLVQSAEQTGNTQFELDHEALLVSPKRPILAELGRLDRLAISKFFKEGFQKGKLDLRSHFKLAFEADYAAYRGSLFVNLRGIAHHSGLPCYSETFIWPMQRLLGSFSDLQYSMLLRGNKATYMSLSPVQKRFLVEWIAPLMTQKPNSEGWVNTPLKWHGSELLADINPSELKLSLTQQSDYMIRLASGKERTEDGTEVREFLQGLANITAYKMLQGEWKSLDDYDPNGFYPSEQDVLQVKLDVADIASWSIDLGDEVRDDTSKKRKYADMPAAFRKVFEDQLKVERERIQASGGVKKNAIQG